MYLLAYVKHRSRMLLLSAHEAGQGAHGEIKLESHETYFTQPQYII